MLSIFDTAPSGNTVLRPDTVTAVDNPGVVYVCADYFSPYLRLHTTEIQ